MITDRLRAAVTALRDEARDLERPSLENVLDVLDEVLDAHDVEPQLVVEPHGINEPLDPDRRWVRFVLGDGGGGGVRWDDGLYVRGSGPVAVLPNVSNALTVVLR